MVKAFFLFKRLPGMSSEEFHRYWRDEHGPLFRATSAAQRYVVRYEQNHVTPTNAPFGEPDFDGISIMWFRSVEDIEALFADREFLEAVGPDGDRFIEDANTQRIVTFAEEVSYPGKSRLAAPAERRNGPILDV